MSLFNAAPFDQQIPTDLPPTSDAASPLITSPTSSSHAIETDQQPLPDSDAQYLPDSPSETIYGDAEEGEPDRPNEWHGTDQKYKTLIADARQTKDSLDRLADQDWSAHLFNIHGLKRGLYPDILGNDTRYEEWMRKDRLYEKVGWYPSRSWTAWPVEPGVVPRRDERMLWERYRNGEVAEVKKAWRERLEERPSQDLEELLLAEFTKQARKKFECREWDVEHDSETEEEKPQTPDPPRNHRKRIRGDEDADSDHQQSKRVKQIATQEHAATLVNRSGTPLENTMETIFVPIVLADDEEARHKAQPMINTMVSQMDSLLTALHHSRANQIIRMRSKVLGNIADELSQEEDSRSPSPASDARSHSFEPGHSPSNISKAKAHQLRLQRACRPRDWSEVLGMAAIIGFDAEVIRRTQARCEALFAERMTFRTISTASPQSDPPTFPPKAEMLNGVHRDNFMQPIPRHPSRRRRHLAIASSRTADTTSAPTSPTTSASSNSPSSLPSATDDEAEEEEEEEEAAICANCGTNHTTTWRRDPTSHTLLCNPCGVYLARTGTHRSTTLLARSAAKSKSAATIRSCAKCNTTRTPTWRRSLDDPLVTICQKCYTQKQRDMKRKGQGKRRVVEERKCLHCGREWGKGFRRGPEGEGTLCATCGAFWKRKGVMRPLEGEGMGVGGEGAGEGMQGGDGDGDVEVREDGSQEQEVREQGNQDQLQQGASS